MEDHRGLIHSHFVRIDFAGWRAVSIDTYETGSGLFRQRFPRTVFPDDLRGFDPQAVVAANLYLTGVTKASVYVGALEALAEDTDPGAASTDGAVVEVGGASVAVPDGLGAAVCLPGANYSHYAARCADYAECDLAAGSCRTFGADNVELHLPTHPRSTAGRAAQATAAGAIEVKFKSRQAARAEITLFERSAQRLGPFGGARLN